MKRNRLDLFSDENGASLVELGLVFPIFVLMLLGSLDFGRAYYLATEVAGAAHAGALYGSQNPTDTAGMKTAAQDDAPDVPNLSVTTPTYGCECADGSAYSASCSTTPTCSSSNMVKVVNVTVQATYTPLFPWPKNNSSVTFTSIASMRNK
jgi:Flp pilus assembly protein TadG